jgi:hypothetical protein
MRDSKWIQYDSPSPCFDKTTQAMKNGRSPANGSLLELAAQFNGVPVIWFQPYCVLPKSRDWTTIFKPQSLQNVANETTRTGEDVRMWLSKQRDMDINQEWATMGLESGFLSTNEMRV